MADVSADAYGDLLREAPEALAGRSIALVGFMGAGKTTVGRHLSRSLGWESVDTDNVVESQSNMTVREIFDWFGEAHFRELEERVVADLSNGGPRILALGGGAFVQEANREVLKERCAVVYLAAPWTVLSGSISRLKNTRPLLRGRPMAEIEALFESRHPLYDQAHLRVSIARRSPSEIANRILEMLQISPPLD